MCSLTVTEALTLDGRYGLDDLREMASRYHGERGRFAYAAFAWTNAELFDGELPLPLFQWALTPYGKCLGSTYTPPVDPRSQDAVITLHPRTWRCRALCRYRNFGMLGPRFALDVVIHECLHVYIRQTLGLAHGEEGGTSSHDNPVWTREIARLSPRLGLPAFAVSPTKRKRENGKMLRVMPAGCLSRQAIATWPEPLRPAGYYAEASVPFVW